MVDSKRAGKTTKPIDVGRASAPEVVSLFEEGLTIAKHEVATGTVRVTTKTETHEEIAETALDRTAVDVTRVPINRPIDQAPAIRTEGDLTVVPVVEERLVITKQLFLVEELHIRHRTEQEIVREPVSLRRQRAVIEHVDAEGAAAAPQRPI